MWIKVGEMSRARANAGVSVVSFDKYKKYCQNEVEMESDGKGDHEGQGPNDTIEEQDDSIEDKTEDDPDYYETEEEDEENPYVQYLEKHLRLD